MTILVGHLLAAVPTTVSASSAQCYSRLENHWFCTSYLHDYRPELVHATTQHLWITLASVALGLVVALPLALIARRYRRLEATILGVSTGIYTIPSIALFPLIVPFTGLSPSTVIIGLALYTLTILVRNTLEGLRAVPDDVRESAIGLGYSRTRLLLRVELPLALPVIMAGLRIATVSTVALTTVGAIVAYGGLGNLLVDGVNENFKAEVLAASVLCVVLAFALDAVLVIVQRLLTPWTRAGGLG
ncbi:MAG TPA: ABC transporter permease [Marmoricola sp.]